MFYSIFFHNLIPLNSLVFNRKRNQNSSIDYNKRIEKMVRIQILIINLLISVIHSAYRLDLSNPIHLGNGTAISTLDFLQDQRYKKHYYVGFVDGTVKKITADLLSSQTFQALEQVDKFYNYYMLKNHTLNGTINAISNYYVATVSHNQTILKLYTSNNFTQVSAIFHDQPIILYTGHPISYEGKVDFVHILVGNQTIRLIYKTFNEVMVNFTQNIGAGIYCKFSNYLALATTIAGDNITMNYSIHVLASNGYSKKYIIAYQLVFNASTGQYDMNSPSMINVTQRMYTETIVKTYKYSTYIFSQANITGNVYSYDAMTVNYKNFDSSVPKDEFISFFSGGGNTLWLTETQLVALSFYAGTATYSYVSTVSSFPSSKFVHVFGQFFDLFLIPFTEKVYMGSVCLPQQRYNGATCVAFTCNDVNCSVCANQPSVCTTCAANYSLAINGSCYQNFNSSNSTSNSTDASNSSTNSSASNNTFPFLPFDPFSSNASFNMFLGFLQSTLAKRIYQQAKDTAMFAIAIPAARRIASPLFYYFGNFDDLFLYSFHPRTYGETMKFVFGEINQIQAKKWSIVNYQTIVDFFGNSSVFDSFINYQSPYLSATRVFTDGESHDSLSLVASCTNFFVVSAPITLVAFFALSFAFRLLFRFRVSQFLRKFDFLGFLFVLLFDGNVQQFAFFLGFEWREAFSISFSTKLLKSSVVFFGFAVISLSVCGYFVCYAFYRKLNKYFTDNNKNCLSGIFFLLFQNGLRNLVLGMAHSLLRDADYGTLLSSLLSIELISLALFICSANNLIYDKVYSIWIYIFMTIIRLMLISTFFLDFNNTDWSIIENTQTRIVLLMVFIYFGSIVAGVVGLITEIIAKIITIIKSKKSKKSKKQSKYGKMKNRIQLPLERKRDMNNLMLNNTKDQVEKKHNELKQMKIKQQKNSLHREVFILKNAYAGISQFEKIHKFR